MIKHLTHILYFLCLYGLMSFQGDCSCRKKKCYNNFLFSATIHQSSKGDTLSVGDSLRINWTMPRYNRDIYTGDYHNIDAVNKAVEIIVYKSFNPELAYFEQPYSSQNFIWYPNIGTNINYGNSGLGITLERIGDNFLAEMIAVPKDTGIYFFYIFFWDPTILEVEEECLPISVKDEDCCERWYGKNQVNNYNLQENGWEYFKAGFDENKSRVYFGGTMEELFLGRVSYEGVFSIIVK